MDTKINKEEIHAALNILQALTETIRDLKTVPNGELWVHCMRKISFSDYTRAIEMIKNTGLVVEKNNQLIWTQQELS